MSTGTWEPILDGPAAATAWQAIRDVARAVADGQGTRRRPADVALFWAYVAGAIEEDWVSRCYDEAIEKLSSAIEEHGRFLGLHGGLAGTGFVIAHISEDGAADEVLGEIDRALGRALECERWQADYDLISGLVGYGVYFLERGDAPDAQAGLTRVLGHLHANRELTPEGATWHTAPGLLVPWQRVHSPDGYYNCGLAHGVPGVIALLGRTGAASREPCREALRWLGAQQLPAGFPAAVTVPPGPREAARTAWCYGDPGVAIAAWGASARLGLPTERWRELALACAARTFEDAGVRDAGLCHGAAGLGHIYNRCYQATREPALRDAARGWFERALAMRRPDGVGGFTAWTSDGTHTGWQPAVDLVEGAIGVALALLAAVHPTEPAWDRLFQCDLPQATGL